MSSLPPPPPLPAASAAAAAACRYVKFDTFHTAVDAGLPVTRVINRYTLQQILADAVIKYVGQA